MLKLGAKYLFIAILLILVMLTIDIWQLDRLEKTVRNTLETAQQAAIVEGMEEESMMYIDQIGIGLNISRAENAFYKELQRGLNLNSSNKPKDTRWLQDFKLEYFTIVVDKNVIMPIITTCVEAKVRLMVAPLIGYSSDTIKVQLADRNTVVWGGRRRTYD